MKEKLEKFLRRHNQTSIFLWMIVGGYLVYLAWQLFSSEPGDTEPVIITAAIIFFTIAGLALVGVGMYAMIKKCYKVQSVADTVSEDEGEDKAE